MHNDGNPQSLSQELWNKLLRQKPDGIVPFDEYMAYCLYDPSFGYYMRPGEKLGRAGDFYTSAHVGSIMGELLASYISELDKQAGRPNSLHIVEWGGGDGRLAAAILEEIQALDPELYDRVRYISIERSPVHQLRQAERLRAFSECCTWMTEEEWLNEKDKPYTIVLANELLDAFPVRRLRAGEHGYEEMWVAWDEERGTLASIWKPLTEERVRQRIDAWGISWQAGQQFELHEQSLDWLSTIAQTLSTGSLIVLDYGDGQTELYGAHRMNGTFLCYRQHQAFDDAFAWPGAQDMTSHVPFEQCKWTLQDAGLERIQMVTQKQFLVENGILDKLQSHGSTDPFSEAARRNRSIRQLLLSDGMSELFKVLTAHKE